MTEGGIRHLHPNGNAPGWGGLQWLYFPDDDYSFVRVIVGGIIEQNACRRVIIHGFSNGAAAAGKLFCRGETFEHRVIGYVLDDPVPDHGVEPCTPAGSVKMRLYWTGALAQASDGWSCKSADWTCEGDTTIGITKYARAVGVSVTPSIHKNHEEYRNPPEYRTWW